MAQVAATATTHALCSLRALIAPRQVDVFQMLVVALPVCVANNHWVAVALHMQRRQIAVYDSLQHHPQRRKYNKQIKAAVHAYVGVAVPRWRTRVGCVLLCFPR